MTIQRVLEQITEELRSAFSALREEELEALEQAIRQAHRVFVAGSGRSLLMIRGLAMRLMHIGLTAYVVGETVTPAIEPGDLLIIASGSGATGAMQVMAQRCRQAGARLALITARPQSPIGQLADLVVTVRAAAPKASDNAQPTAQLGANTFEQSVLLIGDAIVVHIAQASSLEEKNAELMRRHANLE